MRVDFVASKAVYSARSRASDDAAWNSDQFRESRERQRTEDVACAHEKEHAIPKGKMIQQSSPRAHTTRERSVWIAHRYVDEKHSCGRSRLAGPLPP